MSSKRRAGLRAYHAGVLVALAAALAGTALAVSTATVPARSSIPNGNLIPNPSFEGSTAGWIAYHGRLSSKSAPDAPDGAAVAELRRTSSQLYAIRSATAVALSAGTTYVATAWVSAGSRSARGKRAVLAVRELGPRGDPLETVASLPHVLRSGFQAISVSFAAARVGERAELEVLQRDASRGDALLADAVTLAPEAQFLFADHSADGWSTDGGGGIASPSPPGTHVPSLALTLTGRGNAAFRSPAYPTGIVTGSEVTYRLFAPASSAITAVPYTVDRAWRYTYLRPVPALAGSWRTISFRVPALVGGIRYFGVQFLDGQGWAGTLYLADVHSGPITPPGVWRNDPWPTGAPHGRPVPQGPPGPWALAFEDEFAGSALDRHEWSACFPWGCAGNYASELQCYRPGNAVVSDGALKLQATSAPSACDGRRRPYSSALITTYHSYRFRWGYVEVRFRLPFGTGFWPVVELLSAGLTWPPEIDAVEALGRQPNTISMHYHYSRSAYAPGWEYTGPDFTAGFHTVGVDVERTAIRWYVDGQLWAQFADRAALAVLQQPLYLAIGLALGGPYQEGPPPSQRFPASMQIDYVRAWKRPG
ncbi:MAG: glycoside hydrolase family 16 protein [Solirubrobacterales bacterium]|nr:glycoside hydrolase family 16 protein [Solirubrobacterales bacterium]